LLRLDYSLPQLPCLLILQLGGHGVQRGAKRHATKTLARGGGTSIRPKWRFFLAGIAALAMGVALELHVVTSGASISETIEPSKSDRLDSLGSRIPDTPEFRLASLETEGVLGSAHSFDERFAGAADWPRRRPIVDREEHPDDMLLSSPDLDGHPVTRRADRSVPGLAPLHALPAESGSRKKLRLADAENSSSAPEADDHTAIYDIAAHTVYLPNGQRLEAHSGLGSRLDDPRYVTEKDRGPTPPNVYDLSLREDLFHGVRAIRLNPVGGGNMFGRDGMLAHTYMLGPNGQSNGCVSFRDYPAFLNAFLSGEVNRLVVVEHLAATPSSKTATGSFADTIKSLFRRS
jgi:hypothetical protein